MEAEFVNLIKTNQRIGTLLPTEVDTMAEELKMEMRIKRDLTFYREDLELGTKFDEQIAYVLSTALTNYESERVSGQTYATDEFQSAIRTLVPDEHVFKAFPIQFKSKDFDEIWRALKAAPVKLSLFREKV